MSRVAPVTGGWAPAAAVAGLVLRIGAGELDALSGWPTTDVGTALRAGSDAGTLCLVLNE